MPGMNHRQERMMVQDRPGLRRRPVLRRPVRVVELPNARRGYGSYLWRVPL